MSKQSRSQPGAAVPSMPQAIGDGGQTAADWSSTPAAIAAQPTPARANKTIFAILSAVCLLVAAGYIGWAVLRGQSPRNGAGDAAVPVVEGDSASIALLAKQPHVLFQSQSAAHNTDGHRVALSTLDGLSGPRTLTPAQCQRVYYAGGQGL